MPLCYASGNEIATGVRRLPTRAGRTAAGRSIARSAIAFGMVIIAPLLVQAQTPQDWIDERVVPKSRDFKLQSHDQGEARSGFALTIYRVVKIDGAKLWLESEEPRPRTGWVPWD
jgi:hypothetical protein